MKKTIKLITLFIFVTIFTACSTIDKIRNNNSDPNNLNYNLGIVFTSSTNEQMKTTSTSIGYPVLSTILTKYKNQMGKNNVLYLDGGNAFYGFNKGKSIVRILNALGLNATTLGNKNFNEGIETIKSLEMRANFKFLASNIKTSNDDDFATPYTIKEVNGIKIGILGIVSPENLRYSNDLNVEEPILSANRTVNKLKSLGAKYIIALTNLGMNNSNQEWNVDSVAKSVPGIDLILDGKSSYPMEQKLVIKHTPIIQVGENFENIGVIKVDLNARKTNPAKTQYQLIRKIDLSISSVKNNSYATAKQITNNFMTHTVVKGDTLYSLAKKYNTTVDNIVSLNPQITDGQSIIIGQTYKMVAENSKVAVNNNGYINYTVVKGDTLYSLAKKYNTTIDNIINSNPGVLENENIKIGLTYKIPTSSINKVYVEETETYQEAEENDNSLKADPEIENLISKFN